MAYAFTQFNSDTMARAQVRDASISFKKGQMVAKKLRGMMSDKALTYLEAVQAEKMAVPFTKYTNGAGHKPGMGPGKYPIKAAFTFAELLKSCVANAENKGLGTPLKILHVMCQEGSRPMRAGRQRSRQAKRTHIELVLVETEESKKRPKKAKKKASVKPELVKKAVSAEPKAEEKKPVEKVTLEMPKKKAPEKSELVTKATSKSAAPAVRESTKSKEEPKATPKEAVKNGN